MYFCAKESQVNPNVVDHTALSNRWEQVLLDCEDSRIWQAVN